MQGPLRHLSLGLLVCVGVGLCSLAERASAEGHGHGHGHGHVCETLQMNASNLLGARVKTINWAKQQPRQGFPNFRIAVNWDETITQLPNQYEIEKYTRTAIDFWSKSLLVRYPMAESIRVDRNCAGQPIYKEIGGVNRTCCVRVGDIKCIRPNCGGAGVPDNALTACCWCETRDPSSCRVEGYDGEGVKNADFLMLAVSKPVLGCNVTGVLAYAGACYLETEYWRPIIGVVNLCAGVVNHTTGLDRYSEVQVLKHEIAHALGFSAALYGLWHGDDGRPLTPFDNETGMPIVNRTTLMYEVSENVLRRVRRGWATVSGVQEREFTYIVTPRVTKEVRDYFSCPSLEGAELENHGSSGTAGSHFEKRLYPAEGMNGVLSEWMNVSSISLAFMQDTGWYVANFSNAEPYTYGKGLGCAFAQDSCMTWIRSKREKGENPAPYCDVLSSPSASKSERRGTCTDKHDHVAQCTLTTSTSIINPMYRYFDYIVPNGSPADVTARYGGFEYADYCPYLQLQNIPSLSPSANSNRYRMCRNEDAQVHVDYDPYLETYGPSSSCMRQATPVRKYTCVNNTAVSSDASIWGAGCYQVLCGYSVSIQAQYRTLVTCETEYETKRFEVREEGAVYQGALVCPSCAEACGTRSCPMKKVNPSTVNPEHLFEIATNKSLVDLGIPEPNACYNAIQTSTQYVTVTIENSWGVPNWYLLLNDLPRELYLMCGQSPSTCSPTIGVESSKSTAVNQNNYKVILLQQVEVAYNMLDITLYVSFSDETGKTVEVGRDITTAACKKLDYVNSIDYEWTPPGPVTTHTYVYEIVMWVFVSLTAFLILVVIVLIVMYAKKKSNKTKNISEYPNSMKVIEANRL